MISAASDSAAISTGFPSLSSTFLNRWKSSMSSWFISVSEAGIDATNTTLFRVRAVSDKLWTKV